MNDYSQITETTFSSKTAVIAAIDLMAKGKEEEITKTDIDRSFDRYKKSKVFTDSSMNKFLKNIKLLENKALLFLRQPEMKDEENIKYKKLRSLRKSKISGFKNFLVMNELYYAIMKYGYLKDISLDEPELKKLKSQFSVYLSIAIEIMKKYESVDFSKVELPSKGKQELKLDAKIEELRNEISTTVGLIAKMNLQSKIAFIEEVQIPDARQHVNYTPEQYMKLASLFPGNINNSTISKLKGIVEYHHKQSKECIKLASQMAKESKKRPFDIVMEWLKTNPTFNISKTSEQIGVSIKTINTYLEDLKIGKFLVKSKIGKLEEISTK